MIISTLTNKGQTTIPREVRTALHLKPRQRIAYQIQGHRVILTPHSPTLLRFFGSVSSGGVGASDDWKRMETVAHQAAARHVVTEGRRR